MDPSSPYAMRAADRPEGPLRRRLRLRHRSRPARHRHRARRPDDAQPLPGGRDRTTCSAIGRSWPARRGGRQDGGQQQHDRSRRRTQLGRRLYEVPVGFKWFVDGLLDGSLGFGGEESAGASFLRRDGSVWTTDKDGIIPALLAAEITARTGRDPGELYERAHRGARRAGLRAHRRAGDARAEAAARRAVAGRAARDGAGRRADRAGARQGAGQRRGDRRPQGRSRRTAGSPRARPAPKTSTRSTPRASPAPNICNASRTKRRRSSTGRSPRRQPEEA